MTDRSILQRILDAVKVAVDHLFAPRELVWTVAACAAVGGVIWRAAVAVDARLAEHDAAFMAFCLVLALATAAAWRGQGGVSQ